MVQPPRDRPGPLPQGGSFWAWPSRRAPAPCRQDVVCAGPDEEARRRRLLQGCGEQGRPGVATTWCNTGTGGVGAIRRACRSTAGLCGHRDATLVRGFGASKRSLSSTRPPGRAPSTVSARPATTTTPSPSTRRSASPKPRRTPSPSASNPSSAGWRTARRRRSAGPEGHSGRGPRPEPEARAPASEQRRAPAASRCRCRTALRLTFARVPSPCGATPNPSPRTPPRPQPVATPARGREVDHGRPQR